jgi:hypothetical protein
VSVLRLRLETAKNPTGSQSGKTCLPVVPIPGQVRREQARGPLVSNPYDAISVEDAALLAQVILLTDYEAIKTHNT